MNEVFFLEHISEREEKEWVKLIGVFSERIKAVNAMELLKSGPLSGTFPASGFRISADQIDRMGWSDGFTSWTEASK